MSRVRVIALGSVHGADDELALQLGERLARELGPARIELVLAGRPGPGLLDLLDTDQPVLLLDVVRSGAAAGTVHQLDLRALAQRSVALDQVSSHGFGPAESLRLARALHRPLPEGSFVGIEGERFELGAKPSAPAQAAFERFAGAAAAAIETLAGARA